MLGSDPMLTPVITAAILAATAAQANGQETRQIGHVGQCDPQGGPRLIWTDEARKETRQRVAHACRSTGASKAICAWLDASVVRESSGRPGVWHDQKRGIGPLGLLIASHRDKWPGDTEHPDWCQPEASALVALEVAHRAYRKYEATNLVLIQSIYSGRWRCYSEPGEPRRCFASRTDNPRLCAALAARGVGCYDRIEKKDLGRRIPTRQRKEVAEALAEEFDARRDTALGDRDET